MPMLGRRERQVISLFIGVVPPVEVLRSLLLAMGNIVSVLEPLGASPNA